MVRAIELISRIYRKVLLAALFTFCMVHAYCLIDNDSTKFEILINSKLLKEIKFNDRFLNSIDITPGKLILLSTADQLYLLGWGAFKAIGKKSTGEIYSFAFTPDNLLMAVQNKELCGIDTAGSLAKIFNLPNDKMGISAGKYVMYVYDQNSQKVSQSLYLVAHGGKYSKLIEIHKPINAVIEYRNSPLFATGNTLFHLDPKVREPKVFVALPSNDIIKSATIDTSSNRVYVATDNMVYAVKDSNVVLVTDKFGGIIRFLDGGLIVFNPEKKYLIRILGVENKITSQFIEPKTSQSKEQPSDIITNAMVIDMVKLKLSDRLIINMINKSDANFNLGVDEMIFLSGQNVSSEVIMAMKNAMRRKASNAPNNTKQ